MKLKPIIFTGLVATLLMSGINFIQGEETLVPEDGKVAATKLPLDQKTAKVKYETAQVSLEKQATPMG